LTRIHQGRLSTSCNDQVIAAGTQSALVYVATSRFGECKSKAAINK